MELNLPLYLTICLKLSIAIAMVGLVALVEGKVGFLRDVKRYK